ncbi:MAG: class I SAM-dependent methyltransferase [Anaerolineae bacterium]|nr:class I SAM-dependent methyltransferase [Anaerolineae bacterium]
MTQSVTFDRAADFYDATRSYPPEVEMLVADLIVQAGNLHRNSHVAEVGVGTGRVALPVAKRVGRITGIDLSRLMMKRLRAKQDGEQIHLVEGDITLLPFRDQAFDAVMASHIFHLVPGWQQALREVTRVLKPGAPLIHIWQQDNDLFRPLWKAWQEALGGRSDDMVGADWRRNPNFLVENRWQPAGDLLIHGFSRPTTPARYLEQIRQRMWSMCWRYDDDELATGVSAMEAAVPTAFGSLETELEQTIQVHIQAYFPPAN